MAKKKTDLINPEIVARRKIYIDEIFENIDSNTFSDAVKRFVLDANLSKKINILHNKIRELQNTLLKDAESELTDSAVEISHKLEETIIRFFANVQISHHERKKMVEEFWFQSRKARYSRQTKAITVGMGGGVIFFLLALGLIASTGGFAVMGVGIALAVIFGVGLLGATISTLIKYLLSPNKYESRGKEVKDALLALVSKEYNLFAFISARKSHVEKILKITLGNVREPNEFVKSMRGKYPASNERINARVNNAPGKTGSIWGTITSTFNQMWKRNAEPTATQNPVTRINTAPTNAPARVQQPLDEEFERQHRELLTSPSNRSTSNTRQNHQSTSSQQQSVTRNAATATSNTTELPSAPIRFQNWVGTVFTPAPSTQAPAPAPAMQPPSSISSGVSNLAQRVTGFFKADTNESRSSSGAERVLENVTNQTRLIARSTRNAAQNPILNERPSFKKSWGKK